MESSSSYHHPKPTLLLIISILYTNFAQPPSHICPPFDCGNGVVVRYPLWHHSQQLEHCGYKGLNLSCNDQNPALNISNNLYNIISFNYSDNSLIISYSNQIKEQKCPKIPNNATTTVTNKSPLFNYTKGNKLLSFFYNCSLYPPSQQDIKCLQFGTMRSFVFSALAIPEFDWHAYCESTVTVPVLDDGKLLLEASSLGRALTEGFKLTWQAPAAGACQACEASDSNGFCGYSTNGTGGQEFFCICPDGRHSISCYGEGVVTFVPNYINVGALTVGGLTIVATVSYFINKKRAASYKQISHK